MITCVLSSLLCVCVCVCFLCHVYSMWDLDSLTRYWALIGSMESSPPDRQESPKFVLFLWGEMIRTQGWEGFVNPYALTGLSTCFNEKGTKTMQAKGSLLSATWLCAHRAAVLGDALLCYVQTLAEVKTTVTKASTLWLKYWLWSGFSNGFSVLELLICKRKQEHSFSCFKSYNWKQSKHKITRNL